MVSEKELKESSIVGQLNQMIKWLTEKIPVYKYSVIFRANKNNVL